MSDCIEIKGARVNNLKNINVKIPRNTFTVIAGVSGSGKSSLAFDTLYAEGQRRYVESLSSYARQFLGRMSKPECDYIRGIPPAIAIEQKVISRNPRSTVGTTTEIYEYLRLLYARIGHTYSPISGCEVKKHSTEDVVKQVLAYSKGTKFVVLAPIHVPEGRTMEQQLKAYLLEGFARLFINNDFQRIDDILSAGDCQQKEIYLVIDRLSVDDSKDVIARLVDSAETAFYEGGGEMRLMYGVPTMNYMIRGQVKSPDGKPLKDIRVNMLERGMEVSGTELQGDAEAVSSWLENTAVKTDKKGRFEIKNSGIPQERVRLIVRDVDGKENGEYKDRVVEMDVTPADVDKTDAAGWNQGTFDKDVEIELETR